MTISENYKIIFTNDCRKEMYSIYEYISEKLSAINSAKALMKKVEETINKLRNLPEAYPIVKKYKELSLEYRKITIGRYIIIYTVSHKEKKVYIVHMFYGKSNYFNKI